jgi:uncharacterized protein (DUF433 family)
MKVQDMIHVSADTLGGTPVFKGTRVPVSSLFEHLQSGISLNEFLNDFPSVTKPMAEQIIEFAKMAVLSMAVTESYYENIDRRKSA